MRQETQELKNIPLSFLISAPLNAAIEAQRASALSTAAFVEQVGFLPKDKKLNLFSKPDNTYDVRQAVVKYQQDEVRLTTPGDPNATPPTRDVYTVVKGVERTLQLPFISLLNIPTFEVSELNIDFNVRLKGITQLEAEFNTESSSTASAGAQGGADLGAIGIPLNVGASMKVETTSRSQFGLRYGEGHEAEYNLHVSVKAVQAAPPKGIDRLLALAEKIVDASEKANAELARLNAP